MTLRKRNSIKKRLFPVLALASLGVSIIISGLFMFIPAPSSVRAATMDCSDVFTPLSSFVTNGVAANKNFYLQAMNETGVPWELLAAIHYRETNFSHTNPSNGQGIFQFVSGAGGPYPAGPVSDTEFYRQLKFMATQVQTVYALRNSPNSAPVTPRALTANEQDINLVKNTLYSYNGRATAYANQGAQYGYSSSSQPYEGSPYVMNRFDCPRARMGIITQDYGSVDGTDTRYGAFTIFARLRGDNYWLAMTQAYSWNLTSQSVYVDPGRTSPANLSALATNTQYYVRIEARNIGSSTWTNTGNNPVRVGTAGPKNRTSAFCDSSWLSCNRPANLKESSVAPGQIGTFEFIIKTPQNYSSFTEYFNLLSEGNAWMNDIGMYYQFTTLPDTYWWRPVSQAIYTDSGRTLSPSASTLSPNAQYYARVKVLNSGNTTWSNSGNNPVRLATSGPQNRTSAFCDSSWLSCNRPANLIEASVSPGQIGTFEFVIKTPNAYGSFNEYFNLVHEGRAWMNDNGLYFALGVKPPTPAWQYAGQNAYTNSGKTTPINLWTLPNSTRFYVTLSAINTGNTTWTNSGNNPVRLGTTSPQNRTSAFCDSSWLSCNRPANLDQASVAPGQTGTFSFWMQAPVNVNGFSYYEYFQPVVEGSAWMNNVGLYWSMVMQSSLTTWQYAGQNAYSDAARTQLADLSNATPNTTYYLELRAKNTSGDVWSNSTDSPLRLAIPNNQNSSLCHSSWLSCNRPALLKEQTVNPGQTGTFVFAITTPSNPTDTRLYARPVIDGRFWLDDIGLYWPIVTR